MLIRGRECLGDGVRWVGDPVDVVTGALVEAASEFTVAGAPEIVWKRHYSSARAGAEGALGWGQTHSYDWTLRAAVDGWLASQPDGGARLFPYDAPERPQRGWTLRHRGEERELVAPEGTRYLFGGPEDELLRLRRQVRGASTLTFAYDREGRLIELADLDGARRVALEWSGRRIAAALLVAHPRRGAGRPLTLTRYEYDARGDLRVVTDRYGHPRTYCYDAAHRVIERSDRNGYRFLYRYDAQGRCVHAQGEDGVEAVTLRYLPEAQATVVRLADGGEWLHRFDESGSIVEIVDPYGGRRRFEYDDEGRLSAETDPGGNRRTAIHDAAGEVSGWINAAGGLRPADDPTGPPAHRVPATPAELELGDLAAELLEAAPPASPGLEPLLHAGASIFSELFAERDPRVEAACTRDECGLLLAEERAGSPPRRWTYTPSGWVRGYVDHEGGRYDFDYRSWNHRVAARDPLGRTLRYEYTPRHEIAAVVDPAGIRHEYRYDLRNLLTEVRREGALREAYEHDAAGHMVKKRDGGGALLATYEYGPDNLKRLRRLADGEEHRYAYAPGGRFARIEYGGHVLEFGYAGGRRCRDLRDGQGVEHRFEGGGVAETRVLGRFVTRYRRLDAETVEIEDPTGARHALVLGKDGVLVRRMACGAREVVQFDGLGRCLSKHLYAASTGAPVWRRHFEYSPEGDLRGVDDSEAGRTEYRYDAAHQLAGERGPRGEGEYRYDAAGTLLAAPHLRDTEVEAGRLVRSSGGELEYNERGEVAVWRRPDGELRLHHDALGRLRQIEGLAAPWSAEYDPLGRRTHKTFGAARTEYFWDSDRLAAELGHDGRLRVYVYADDFSLTPWLAIDYDSLDAEPASGKLHYLVCDQRGAPVAAFDAAGERVWRAHLHAYGLATIETRGEFDLALGLAGQLRDPETGLCYNRFRYYCPELGRYFEEDPAGTGGGVNLYAYTDCPLVHFDPRGACPSGDGPPKTKEDQSDNSPKSEAFPELRRGGDADLHVDHVTETYQNLHPTPSKEKSITVIVHEDGTVSVGLSGKDPARTETTQRLVTKLNEGKDPPVYRTSGPVDSRGLDSVSGSPQAGNCSEAQAAQASGTSTSPPKDYQTVWAKGEMDGKTSQKHGLEGRPKTKGGFEKMKACDTCACNSGKYSEMSKKGISRG